LEVMIVAPYRVFPAVDGASNRVKALSLSLRELDVSVTLLHAGGSGRVRGGLRVVGYPALESLPLTRASPLSRGLDAYLSPWNPYLCEAVLRAVSVAKPDIIQIEGPWSVYAAGLARRRGGGPPLVYDAHNVEALAARYSGGFPAAWPYAKYLEGRAVEASDAVLCVSELDKARMCSLYRVPQSRVAVVPNGVHVDRYRLSTGEKVRRRLGLSEDTGMVFFHGLLQWRPNLEAARIVVERLAPRFEARDAVFLVAGAYPPRALLEAAAAVPNVRVLGYVEAVEEYVCASDVCVAPMVSGSGTKLKVLEYLAAGKPVVATRRAVEGMGVRDGVEALIVDDAGEGFVDALRRCLQGWVPGGLREGARAYAEGHDWTRIAERALRVYDSLSSQLG
jgi:glycosyltransferase involved in cell wall biosynthesis